MMLLRIDGGFRILLADCDKNPMTKYLVLELQSAVESNVIWLKNCSRLHRYPRLAVTNMQGFYRAQQQKVLQNHLASRASKVTSDAGPGDSEDLRRAPSD